MSPQNHSFAIDYVIKQTLWGFLGRDLSSFPHVLCCSSSLEYTNNSI